MKKILLFFGLLVFLNGAFALSFNGTTYYYNGTPFSGVNVSITMRNQADWSIVSSVSSLSNDTGFFELTVPENQQYVYEIRVYHFNDSSTNQTVDWVGPIAPPLMLPEFQMIANGMSFYLREGATLNFTVQNGTGDLINFTYQIKDEELGYPVAEQFNNYSSGYITVHVPADRNYSIMVYPENHFPVNVRVNSSELSDHYFNYTFNASESMVRVSGYATYQGSGDLDELTIISYLMESNNMVYFGHPLPYNMSNDDNYTPSQGFYNISLPGAAEGADYLLFAVARNGSNYYGAFANLTLNYGDAPQELNFTLWPLVGSPYNISVKNGTTQDDINITIAAMKFNLLNSSGFPIFQAHIEVELDYTNSTLNGTSFTWMADIQQNNNGSLYIPLLLGDVKKMNIYQMGPPVKKTFTANQISSGEFNVSLPEFDPGAIEPGEDFNVNIVIYKNNATCDVPYPPPSCILTASSKDAFNPIQTILSGGKISFRMYEPNTNITVHYVNVDLLASGPPDALFDNRSHEQTASGSAFEQAWRFGSQGPEIYDYVLIGIPYTPATTSQTGLNESAPINVSIPYLYGENFSVPIWNASAGNNITHIQQWENLTDFEDYVGTEYEAYLNGTGVSCSTTDSNLSSSLCYKDTQQNMIWIRIPHFSGIGPAYEGNLLKANGETCSAASECVGGYCVHGYCRSSSTYCGDGYCDSGEDSSSCSADCGSTSSGGGSTTTTAAVSHIYPTIEGRKTTIMDIVHEDIPLTELKFTLRDNADNVKITVKSYSSKPSDIEEAPNTAYKYLEITARNIEADNIDGMVEIKFTVEDSWINENNFSRDGIAMYHYGEDGWELLSTEYLSTENEINYYRAFSPSFSYFAITGKIKEVLVPSEEEEEEESAAPTKETKSSHITKGKDYWVWIVVILIAAAILLYLKFGGGLHILQKKFHKPTHTSHHESLSALGYRIKRRS